MKSVNEVYGAPPGWEWREKWIHNEVAFEHGELVSGPLGALNAAIQNQMPTVIGHLHSNAGVIHRASETSSLWGLNTGCLIDVQHYCFQYGKLIRVKPSLGCGVIKNSIPYFVPMLVDPVSHRWTGLL